MGCRSVTHVAITCLHEFARRRKNVSLMRSAKSGVGWRRPNDHLRRRRISPRFHRSGAHLKEPTIRAASIGKQGRVMKSKSTSKTLIEDCDQCRRCRVFEGRDSVKRYRGLVSGKAAQLRRARMSGHVMTATSVACAAGDASTTSADRWARPNLELLEDRRGDLPELPVESLGPATQLWLRRAARAAGVTPAHVFAPAISITSTLVGAARRVRASSSFSQPL